MSAESEAFALQKRGRIFSQAEVFLNRKVRKKEKEKEKGKEKV
jgi:hypothetical protein